VVPRRSFWTIVAGLGRRDLPAECHADWRAMVRLVVAGLAVVFGLGLIQLSGMPIGWTSLAMTVVVFPVVAAVTGQLRKLLLAVILLELPFPLDIYLRYNEDYASLGAIGGINVSVTTVALVVLYALWLGDVIVVRHRGDRTGRRVRATLPLTGYVTLVVASMLVAKDRAMAINQVAILVQMLLLYLYLLHAVRSWLDVRFVVSMLLLGLVVESAIMLALPLVGESFTVGFVNARLDEATGRVGGTIGSHNAAGAYLAVMIPVAMAVLVSSQRGLLRVGALAGLALGGIAIILTGCKGAWIGLVLAAVILCVSAWRRGWLSPRVPVAIGLGGVCLAVLFQSVLAERIFPENQSAALSRIPLMSLAGRMIANNPVLGVGANNFVVRAEDYWTNRTEDEWLFVVHNEYLLIASESGLLALLMYALFLYVTIRYGFRASRGRDRFPASVALGLTAGLVGHTVLHYQVEFFNDRGQVELLWVLAALIAVVYRINVQRAPEPDNWDMDTITASDPSDVVSSDPPGTLGKPPNFVVGQGSSKR
jgi:putative inorganic carbon (HCO3(-)) transporter